MSGIDTELKNRIIAAGQEHLLRYFNELDEAGKKATHRNLIGTAPDEQGIFGIFLKN